MPIDTLPDAEAQLATLADRIRPHLTPDTALVGIHSGGAWIAERLRSLLGVTEATGTVDVSFYRDDFAAKGLHPQVKPSAIPFEVEGRPLILVDDVLYTGRTTRAAINELFDYGRPARIDLAVLLAKQTRLSQHTVSDITGVSRDTIRKYTNEPSPAAKKTSKGKPDA